MEQLVAQEVHILRVVGSSPASATKRVVMDIEYHLEEIRQELSWLRSRASLKRVAELTTENFALRREIELQKEKYKDLQLKHARLGLDYGRVLSKNDKER